MNTEPDSRRPNRKRKKSFLKNARKYGKKGYYGRGSQLDGDTYQYFVRIMEAYRQGFESNEDKQVFVNNVFEQTIDQEINCSSNQVGCRVVETLLPFANDNVLKKFMDAFSSDLRPLCSDRFASHVLEGLVEQGFKKYLDVEISEDLKDQYKGFSLKVSKFLLNNLEDYIWDTYGNHVIRTCLRNLAQLPKDESSSPQSHDNPEEFTEIVRDYGQRLISWPQFSELCNSELTSGFLQILLKCLHKLDAKLMKLYLKKFSSEIFILDSKDDKPEVLPNAFLSKSLIMLLETVIQIAPNKIYNQLYTTLFEGRFIKLSTTRNTNFAVQKLIQQCNDKEQFEAIFDEIAGHFEDVLASGHTGVIFAISEGCKRLMTKQGCFVQNLMKALHCFEPEERHNDFVLCLSRMKNFEESKKLTNENLQKEKLNLHGTLILQLLFNYNKPIKIVNSILSMEAMELKNLFSNTMGSHIMDSYVKGMYNL